LRIWKFRQLYHDKRIRKKESRDIRFSHPLSYEEWNKMTQKIFSISSVLLLLTAVWGAWKDYNREWKKYQRRYNDLVLQRADPKLRDALRPAKLEIKQLQAKRLQRIDRCITCHVAYDNPAFASDEEPLRQHPPGILKSHPVEKYGCTICHGGQGAATTYKGAAHEELEFWEESMWQGEYIQSACGRCHKEKNVPGAPTLSIARVLYEELSCGACHLINGEGYGVGPDLSHVGSKPLHSFDFSHLEGKHSRIRWFIEHFKDPQAVVPDSEMPNLEMTEAQMKAMTVLLLSLTDADLPAEYIVHGGTHDRSDREAPVKLEDSHLLEEKHCLLCHTVEGQGGKVGPELTQIASRRNADWLFQHFKNPGSIVKGSKMPDLNLTDSEANELTRYMLSMKSERNAGP
jgi:cbb3-type cytochrome oxidase cytochrome c subunit